jgi:hypothetical protein
MEAETASEYLKKAVEFVNEKVWGTLTAGIIVHPESMKDPEVAAAVEDAVSQLRYGTVTVNHWGAFSWFLGSTPWGGCPGTDIYDVQSGMGFVNNGLMFDRPKKSVVYSPFIQSPDASLADVEGSVSFWKALKCHEYRPTLGTLWKLVRTTMKVAPRSR